MRTGENGMPPTILPGKADSSTTRLGSPLSLQISPSDDVYRNGVKPLDRTQLTCPVREGEVFPPRPNERKASQPGLGIGGGTAGVRCFQGLVVFRQTTHSPPQNSPAVFSPVARKGTDCNTIQWLKKKSAQCRGKERLFYKEKRGSYKDNKKEKKTQEENFQRLGRETIKLRTIKEKKTV